MQQQPRALGFTALIAAATIFATGCAPKPPDCADPQSVALAKDVVRDAVRQGVLERATYKMPDEPRAAMVQLAETYLKPLKYELTEIVSNGYNADAKKFSCEGKFTIQSGAGSFGARSAYTSQKTQDKAGGFLLTVEKAGEFGEAAFANFAVAVRTGAIAAPVPAAPAVASASAPAQPQSLPPGSPAFASEHGTLRLQTAGTAMSFEMDAAMEDHTCSLSGTAQLAEEFKTFSPGARAVFRSPEKGDSCTVVFKFGAANDVDVSTDDCSAWCGMKAQGALDAVYKRVK